MKTFVALLMISEVDWGFPRTQLSFRFDQGDSIYLQALNGTPITDNETPRHGDDATWESMVSEFLLHAFGAQLGLGALALK